MLENEEEEKKKEEQPNNVLHNVKLKDMLVYLEKTLGWEEMGQRVNIKCFTTNPTMSSSLNFLRKTAWAKEEVQQLYSNAIQGKLKPVRKYFKPKFTEKPKFNEKVKFQEVKKWPFLK